MYSKQHSKTDDDGNEVNLGGLKTFKELFQSPIINKLTKFITKRDFKKFDDQGLVPCYTVNNKKAYKVQEIQRWIIDELTDKHEGTKIISRFNVIKVNLKKATNIPKELTTHGDDLYEYNTYLPPCIYFLIESSQIVYVGQSSSLGLRIHAHSIEKSFDKVLYMPIDEYRLLEVERFFIETLEPKYNKEQFVTNKNLHKFKNLGYKFINKILYKEDSNGSLEKYI